MNARLSSRILMSTLLYATLLATTTAIPLLLAPHDNIAFSGLIMDASAAPMKPDLGARSPVESKQPRGQVWDRFPGLDGSGAATGTDLLRTPHAELPAAQQPDARRPRVDRTGPDAEMIRTGKVRTKTIRV
ncbi:MAG: hypothetical protein ABI771_04315 [Betaproteobacteria bacterium]